MRDIKSRSVRFSEMSDYLYESYRILDSVFRDKAYGGETLYKALENAENADVVYRIVMGVLERNEELDYIVSALTEKRPKNAVSIILKQGIYCLKYMDSLPDYAVVNNSVQLTKRIGKSSLAGFVNAVLKNARDGKYELPSGDGEEALAIKYNKPAWIVRKVISDYGRETGGIILSEKPFDGVHLRTNSLIYNDQRFERDMNDNGERYEKTATGYIAKISPLLKKLFIEGRITYQSYTSTLAVKALDVSDGMKVLDVCSAPGGKAVLIAEKNPLAEVTACDIHAHRVGLIGAYARRMHVDNVKPTLADGTQFNKQWESAFDRVLVDAPCSASGIMRKHPDILLNRKPEDVISLKNLQKKILHNAAKYVKSGGLLVYGTCSVFKEENEENVADFLKNEDEFELFPSDCDGQYIPDGYVDGFYIRRMRRK